MEKWENEVSKFTPGSLYLVLNKRNPLFMTNNKVHLYYIYFKIIVITNILQHLQLRATDVC